MKLKEFMEMAKKENIQLLDVKFTDVPGTWQHFTVPLSEVSEKTFEEGLGFDGSSIRGFQEINESDLNLVPDLSTAIIDPFSNSTFSMVCDIKDPITKKSYPRDPRNIAKKASEYLAGTGIGDKIYFGPEAEFFVFDDIRYGFNEYSAYYYIDSDEGAWNTGNGDKKNLGHKPRHKEGYFPVPPTDSLQELRNDMILTMIKCGIHLETHHHEVATAGQCEIDMRFDELTKMADNVMLYKYVVKNVAFKHGKTATFMPKPIYNDNGSGMHCHQSIWKGGTNLFAGKGYAGLSDMAIHYIGGILKHAHALAAFTNPTTNSYKRIVPGFEAPVNLVYSKRNRSAAVRIPMYSENPRAKRIEYRCPDPTANPYIAFSAMLMAGLDGVKKKIEPPAPVDHNIYDLSEDKMAKINSMPGSLDESLEALRRDNAFLLEGGVFTRDFIDGWIDYKYLELNKFKLVPHPWEFYQYFDA